MKISLKSEYALRALFDLATHPPGARVKSAAIASRQNVSRKLLEMILANLKVGGFVTARRGAEGGYCLTRPPDQITVGEVLAFIGEIVPSQPRPLGPFCDLWSRVDASIFALLDEMTFLQLVRQWEKKQTQYIANWEI